jgi:hypothetical protein
VCRPASAWWTNLDRVRGEWAVNEIVVKRMNQKQQMRWNRATVQPFLDVRVAVPNDALEARFDIATQVFVPPTMTKCGQRPRDLAQHFECSLAF